MGPRGDRPTPRGDRPTPREDRPTPRGDRPTPREDRPTPRGDRRPTGLRVRLRGLRVRLRDAFFRRSRDDEMDEELRFHIEMETEKNVRSGMSPAEARRRALVAFGGVERHRERLREGRQIPILEPLSHDLRLGARSLGREPGLALIAGLTIALGVGGTTSVFSVVNSVLLRPLPIPGVERVGSIQERRSGTVSTGVEGMLIPWERYHEYREATSDIFESLAAHRLEIFSLRLAQATVPASGALTSNNYFETVGVRLALGRPYADAEREVVVSHDLWTTHFGGDPDVLGRTVHLNGRAMTVVGVAPPGFRGATIVADQIWAPMEVMGAAPGSWDRRAVPIGRVRRGVPLKRAAAAVDAVGRRLEPERHTTVHSARLEPLAGGVPSEGRAMVSGFLAMLLGMSLLVLLIASSNIAGVMLARAFARRRELAVRQAMGAGRGRIVRHLLVESLLVFAVGGAGGVALAYLGTAWLAGLPMPPQVSVVLNMTPDMGVLAFAVALTGLSGVVFGLIPALRASRPDLVRDLKAGGGGAVGGEGRLRQLFVGGQLALAVLLLLTATLFGRSLVNGLQAELGIDPHGVVAASLRLGPPLEYDAETGRAFWAELLEGIRSAPGVEGAAVSQFVPLSWSQSTSRVRPADALDEPGVSASYASVDPAYFETLGVEIVAGRALADGDVEGTQPVAVINAVLAERLWPGQNPIGELITGIGPEPVEVVGVAGNGRYVIVTEDPTPFVYMPFAQIYRQAMSLLVRAPGAEGAVLQEIRDQVRAIDPDVAVLMASPLDDIVDFGLFPQRFAAQLVGAFGVVGLILAAMGVYGILAYHVTRRTRELGVRRALGATRGHLIRDVVGRGVLMAAVGCGIGVAAGAGIALVVRGFLYGIEPLDPVTFTAVPALLFAVAVLASWLPALRASAVEAIVALQED